MTETERKEPTDNPPALDFDDVTFRGSKETSIGMDRFTGSINEGDFIQVKLRQHHDPRDLASAMMGLNSTQSGVIRFRGQDWMGNDHERHFGMRCQIGRVFAGCAWVNNLTVLDNVMLSMQHQGVPESETRRRVSKWTERLSCGQSDVIQRAMSRQPSLVEPSILKVCQWIRAVCHQPKLLILERPMYGIVQALHIEILSVIEELRASRTAILVFCGAEHDHEYNRVSGVTHWRMVGNKITQGEATKL